MKFDHRRHLPTYRLITSFGRNIARIGGQAIDFAGSFALLGVRIVVQFGFNDHQP